MEFFYFHLAKIYYRILLKKLYFNYFFLKRDKIIIEEHLESRQNQMRQSKEVKKISQELEALNKLLAKEGLS